MGNREKRKATDIPLSSTSDIAFLLLIFFLVSTMFDIESGILLDLPPSETSEKAAVLDDMSNMVIIDVAMSGNSAKNFNLKYITYPSKEAKTPTKKVIPIRELKAEVKVQLMKKPQTVFMVRTKPDDPYGPMVQVLDQLKVAGAQKYSIREWDQEIE